MTSRPAQPDSNGSDGPRRYGILLPNFGRHATSERIRQAGPLIEGYGFDSVWVRDHVIQQPHGHEDPDLTFLDAFITLTAVGAQTERLKLATAVLIPHRHPILAAMMLASLDFAAGPGRVIAGFGIGNWDAEFEAIGLGGWDRRVLLEEYVGIIRRLWTGAPVSHHGDLYRFEDVQISPVPDPPIPVFYGGNSAAAVRRAVEYCEGWVASRMPISSFSLRISRMRRLAKQHGKATPTAAVVPYVVPADTVEEGVARLNLPALLDELARFEPPPPSGAFDTLEDLGGAAMVGPVDIIGEQVRAFHAEGARHVIFDLRPCLEDWEDKLAVLGEELLPTLRAGDRSSRESQLK